MAKNTQLKQQPHHSDSSSSAQLTPTPKSTPEYMQQLPEFWRRTDRFALSCYRQSDRQAVTSLLVPPLKGQANPRPTNRKSVPHQNDDTDATGLEKLEVFSMVRWYKSSVYSFRPFNHAIPLSCFALGSLLRHDTRNLVSIHHHARRKQSPNMSQHEKAPKMKHEHHPHHPHGPKHETGYTDEAAEECHDLIDRAEEEAHLHEPGSMYSTESSMPMSSSTSKSSSNMPSKSSKSSSSSSSKKRSSGLESSSSGTPGSGNSGGGSSMTDKMKSSMGDMKEGAEKKMGMKK